jgi:hypothetical protein
MRQLSLVCFCILIMSGCVKAVDDRHTRSLPDEPPRPTDRQTDDEALGVGVSVTVPSDAWSWLAANLNRIGVRTTSAIEVLDTNRDGLLVAEGTEISLSVAEESALVEFSGPLPTASKRVGPIPVKTKIKSLTLRPDGSGLAKTGVGTWPFSWLPNANAAGSSCSCGCGKAACNCDKGECPPASTSGGVAPIEVTMETPINADGVRFCGPCKTAEQAVAKSKVPLPFRLKVIEVPESKRAQYPYFCWKSPSGKEWQVVGFTGGLPQLTYSVMATAEQ